MNALKRISAAAIALTMAFGIILGNLTVFAARWEGIEKSSSAEATLLTMEEFGGEKENVLSGSLAPYYRNWYYTDRDNPDHLKSSYVYDSKKGSTVLKLVGSMHLRIDDYLKYNSKYLFYTELKKGSMTAGEFAGVVLDYGNDLLEPVSNYNTCFHAASTPAQGYAGASGCGFTFLADSNDTLRFFMRYIDVSNGNKLDVIYYDYQTEYDLRNDYHVVSVYDDKPNGTIRFYFDGALACYISLTGSASSVSPSLVDIPDHTIDGTYYTSANMYKADGTLAGGTSNKTLIGALGTWCIAVTGTDDCAYFDNVATGDYSSLPDLDDCMIGSASISVSDDITLNVKLRGAPSEICSDHIYINGVDYTPTGLPGYIGADASRFKMRFTIHGRTETVEARKGIFSFEGITMNEMTDDITMELLCGENVIDSVENFTLKNYLTNVYNATDDSTLKLLTADLLNLGNSLQVYSGYNTEKPAFDGTMPVSAPVKPVNYTKERTGNTIYNTFKAVNLSISNHVNILFKYSVTDASRVRIDIKKSGNLIRSYSGSELSDGEGYVSTGGIFACDYSDVYTAELYYDEVKYCTAMYNVNAYLNSKWDTDNESLKNVVRNLSAYSISAAAYSEKNLYSGTGYFDVSYETESYCEIGETIKLNAEYVGRGSEIFSIMTWSSDNEAVATVDSDGVVTGISAGNATITAYSAETGKTFDFTVTILPENMSDALKAVVSNHRSNAHTTYNLRVSYNYNYDVVGSVNNIHFDELVKDNRYLDVLQGEGDAGKNYGLISNFGGVQFITVHYTGNPTYSADADNNADYFNNPGYQASIHWVTGRTNLDGPYSEDDYRAFSSLNEKYAGWHAGDGTLFANWLASGVYVTPGDPEKPVITINASGYYTVNGRTTVISAPGPASKLNKMGVAWKIVDNQYYLDETYVNGVYGLISNRGGNCNSIGIESCVDYGSDLVHTWHVTAQLVAQLMVKYNLDITRVQGHHFFSGKDCPQPFLENNLELWYEFLKYVQAEYDLLTLYSASDIDMTVINGEGVLSKYGLLKQDGDAHCVTYQVEVTTGGNTETITLATIVESSFKGPADRNTLQTAGETII